MLYDTWCVPTSAKGVVSTLTHIIYVMPCDYLYIYRENIQALQHIYIARAMPLSTGSVDIFIGQIHSENNDQIQ